MKTFVALVTGIALGAGVSWVYHKNKYENMVQEEIEELRVHAKIRDSKVVDVEEFVADESKKGIDELAGRDFDGDELVEDKNKVRNIIQYNKYAPIEEECMSEKAKRPFVVTPEDFASIPGFDTDTFYYHNNDVIVNDNSEIVDDIEELFGMSIREIKEQFGVHEESAVYIRNYKLECDYEILLDYSDFHDE